METINQQEKEEVTLKGEERKEPYSWVKEAMKKANDKYRKSHLELTAERQRKYYAGKKNEESFQKMVREKALKYYYKKKEERRLMKILHEQE